jgi:DNA-binding response OmpR family regulator
MATETTRILIVEDNPLIAAMMEAMIGDMGYGVVGPMLNLQDGLDHARGDALDFALLDFDLGQGTDATPIAEALSARGVPFAFITAADQRKIRARFAQAPIFAKPVSESELGRILPA